MKRNLTEKKSLRHKNDPKRRRAAAKGAGRQNQAIPP